MSPHSNARATTTIVYRLVLAALLVGCRDGFAPSTQATDPLRDELIRQGFRPDMIEDRGTYFVVEGDIRIEKRDLMAPDPRQPDRQYFTTNAVSASNMTDIVVNLSGLESSWQTATRAAIAEWNAIPGLRLFFREGTSSADITMTMVDSLYFASCGEFVVAQASFPSGGQPGPVIVVSNQVTNYGCMSASQKKFNMVHELGHTIGFRHTNWNQNDCYGGCGGNPGSYGAQHVPGTPTSGNDAASVMNGGVALNSWNGFSTYDMIAAFARFAGLLTVSASNASGYAQIMLSFPAGWSTAELLIETHSQELDDYGIMQHQWVEDPVTTISWQPTAFSGSHTDWRPWTGTYACGSPQSWSQPYEELHYVMRVTYPNGVLENRTQAPVNSPHGYLYECW